MNDNSIKPGTIVTFRSLLAVDTRPVWTVPVKAAAQRPETVIALRSVAQGSK